jgi:tyrosinase
LISRLVNLCTDICFICRNVDRLFAIWQAINPSSYTINEPTQDGTFVIQAGSTETSTTPLAPFADASGTNYWTPEGVRQTETFNYAYPETQRWAFASDSDYQNSVANAVQQLYGGLSNQFTGDEAFNLMAVPTPAAAAAPVIKDKVEAAHSVGSANVPASDSAQKPVADTHSGPHLFHNLAERVKDSFSHHHQAERGGLDLEKEIGKRTSEPLPQSSRKLTGIVAAPAIVEQPRSYTEYIANIRAPKHILGQSYRVHIFLGEFHTDTRTWNTQDALVGTFTVFGKETTPGNDDETKCGKCKADAAAKTVITGTVPLTAQIISVHSLLPPYSPLI